MPTVQALLSNSVSLGIWAGLVSGIFYLVIAGVRWAGKLRAEHVFLHTKRTRLPPPPPLRCTFCTAPAGGGKATACHGCAARLCLDCARFYLTPTRWLCKGCLSRRELNFQSGDWFYQKLHRRFLQGKSKDNDAEQQSASVDGSSARVREFIERLVQSLVGGELDSVSVSRMYDHREYDRMFGRYHGPLCDALVRLSFSLLMAIANKPLPDAEAPSAAHAHLKRLVNEVIREAMTLPELNKILEDSDASTLEREVRTKTYEDILATAILNKVIARYQERKLNDHREEDEEGIGSIDDNSNHLISSDLSYDSNIGLKRRYISELEIGVACGSASDVPSSSPDSHLHDSASISSSHRTEPISFTIEECIEEVTEFRSSGSDNPSGAAGATATSTSTTAGSDLEFYLSSVDESASVHRIPFPELGMDLLEVGMDSAEEAEPEPTDMVTPGESWEENWLFQKKKLKSRGQNDSSGQPLAVPMLVPNPSEDFKALIGGRDAEEMSDLSDCSDSALEEVISDLRDISQQNYINDEIEDRTIDTGFISLNDEHSSDSLVEAANPECQSRYSLESLSEYGQQDSEYTEHYASVVQRHLNSLSRCSNISDSPGTKHSELLKNENDTISLNEGEVPPETTTQTNETINETITTDKEMKKIELSSLEKTTNKDVSKSLIIEKAADGELTELATPPRPGTIAEYEHRKWESAKPIANNPYSPEAIARRLGRNSQLPLPARVEVTSQGESSPKKEMPDFMECVEDISKYGRDYYVQSIPLRQPSRRSMSATRSSSSSLMQLKKHMEEPNIIIVPKKEMALTPLVKSSEKPETPVSSRIASLEHKINRTYKPKPTDSTLINAIKSELPLISTILNLRTKPAQSRPVGRLHIPEIWTATNGTGGDLRRSQSHAMLHLPMQTLRRGKSTMELNENPPETQPLRRGRSTMDLNTNRNLSSLDLDCNSLPSVRQLAKQFAVISSSQIDLNFSGSGARSSSSSVPGCPEDTEDMSPSPPPMLIPNRPLADRREVHSLTARSISREFREVLRRQLPAQRDRTVRMSSRKGPHDPGSDSGLSKSRSPSETTTSDEEEHPTSSPSTLEIPSTSPTPQASTTNLRAFWEGLKDRK